MFSNLKYALKDEKFCSELDKLNLDYCYSVLEGAPRIKLTDLLRNEIGIDPLYHTSKIVLGMVTLDEETVSIPENITAICEYAFYNCTRLTNITIPDTVTSIGTSAFRNCISLKSISIPNSVTFIGGYAFIGCISLTSITVPDSVTYIGQEAFYNCSSLTSVIIPNSIKGIGSWAFDSCSKLTSITYQGTKKEAYDCGLIYVCWKGRCNIETIRCTDGNIVISK